MSVVHHGPKHTSRARFHRRHQNQNRTKFPPVSRTRPAHSRVVNTSQVRKTKLREISGNSSTTPYTPDLHHSPCRRFGRALENSRGPLQQYFKQNPRKVLLTRHHHAEEANLISNEVPIGWKGERE
ncbi:hypothetical protein NHQ30_003794 [Ciborinia camelliae]|nr:hypothetical protein NHQ30_003794 [Ciborinia camelliae]